jgi:plasmid replication initiation protein
MSKNLSLPSPTIWVRQENSLVDSSYHLTVSEMRLIWHLISLIKPNDEDFCEYEFTASELGQMMGDESLTYAEAEAITLRLWRREIHFQRDNWKSSYRWVIRAKRNPDSGLIRIALDPELKPLLLNLKAWTQAKLEQLCSLSSNYAVRIYLWASKVRNQTQREWTVTIEELKAQLKIPAEEYDRFSNFNAWVLRKPIAEVNEKTDLKLNYQVLRRGRSPYAVRFTVVEGAQSSTGTGELIQAEITKRIKRKSRESNRKKSIQLLLPEPNEISEEVRAANLAQLKQVKHKISGQKLCAK